MAEKFDPYRMWLGIPATEQPPNHYRLLGVGVFESDPDVISNAADRQMVHVRTYQGGKYSALSQRLLNELSAARVCLLDPKKKAEYDEQLRKQMAAKVAVLRPVVLPPAVAPVAVPAPTPVPGSAQPPGPAAGLRPLAPAATPAAMPTTTPAAGPAPPLPPAADDPAVFVPKPPLRSVAGAAAGQKPKVAWQVPAMVGALVLLAVVVAVVWLSQSGGSDAKSSPDDTKAEVASHTVSSPAAASPSAATKKPVEAPVVAASVPAKPKTPQPAEGGIPGINGSDMQLTVQPEATATDDAVGEIRSFPKQRGAVRAVRFSPDGAMLASAGKDRKVWLWNVERAKEVRHFDDPAQSVAALAFSADGKWLAAVTGPAAGGPKEQDPGEPSKLYVWNVSGGAAVVSVVLDAPFSATDLKFSPQKPLLALAGRDGTVRLYDLAEKREVHKLQKHSGPVWSVAFSPDGKKLLSGGEDRSVWLWTVDPPTPLQELAGHQSPVTAVTFSGDGRQAISGSKDKSVLVWSLEKGKLGELKDKPECRFEGLESPITCLAYSIGGQCVVAGDEGGALRLFQPVKGRPLQQFSGHEGAVLGLDSALSGRRVVSAGADGTVRLWGLPDPLSAVAEESKAPPVKVAVVPKKPAVPSEEALKKAEVALKAGPLKDDFQSADRPSRKVALARKLIARGIAGEDDPAGAYAALKLALDLGSELPDTDVAFAAIDGMGRTFDLDPVAAKVDVLETILKAKAAIVAVNRGPWLEKVLTLAQEAVAAEKPDSAERLVLIARPMSKAGRDSVAMAKRVQTLARQVEVAQQIQAEVQKARQRLEAQPDDPEGNEALGRYLCFLKDNWEEGLPRLAKSAEPGLKLLAQTELANPVFVDQQFTLANDWWTLAETQKGKARRHILLHAGHWYGVAEPNLSGADKEQAHKRMIEAGQAETTGHADPVPFPKTRKKEE